MLMDEPFGCARCAERARPCKPSSLEPASAHPKTILFVTHDLDSAVLIADRIVVSGTARWQEVMEVPLARPRGESRPRARIPAFAEIRFTACGRRCIAPAPVLH